MFRYEFRVNALSSLFFFAVTLSCNLAGVGLWVQTAIDGVGLASCLAIGYAVRPKCDK